jgi:hypothetical protein
VYQQLPEFVRREAKAYWFLSAVQAGGAIAGAMIFAFTGLLLLAPVGAVAGVLVFSKRQGVYNYEKVLALGQWFLLQFREDVIDQAELFRTTTPQSKGVVVVRKPGSTIAIRPGERQ